MMSTIICVRSATPFRKLAADIRDDLPITAICTNYTVEEANLESEPTVDRHQFSALIAATLEAHPDWMHAALQGITEGSALALQEAHRRAASKDQAMMAALVLLSSHRLGPDLLATLRDRIAQAINPNGASEIEKKFIAGMTPPVVTFAREQFEALVDALLDDPSDLLRPDREEEPPRVIFGYRKLASDLGLDFDELVAKGSGWERKRLSDIERGIEKPLPRLSGTHQS